MDVRFVLPVFMIIKLLMFCYIEINILWEHSSVLVVALGLRFTTVRPELPSTGWYGPVNQEVEGSSPSVPVYALNKCCIE